MLTSRVNESDRQHSFRSAESGKLWCIVCLVAARSLPSWRPYANYVSMTTGHFL